MRKLIKLGLFTSVVALAYRAGRHHDYFVACAKNGWEVGGTEGKIQPLKDAEDIWNRMNP